MEQGFLLLCSVGGFALFYFCDGVGEVINAEEKKLLKRAMGAYKQKPGFKTAEALYEVLKTLQPKDPPLITKINKDTVRRFYAYAAKSDKYAEATRAAALRMYQKCLLMCARDDFDSFMLFTESDRPFEKQFWIYRRGKMADICQGLQDIADDKLDILFIEEPPRVGKSTLVLWFSDWYGARFPGKSNLQIGHSASLANSYYVESDKFINGKDYRFFEVFPELRGHYKTYAAENAINLGEEKRYKTLQYKSVDAALAGVVEASGLLIVDDVITGIEEALSPDRLDTKRTKVCVDVMQRKANSHVKMVFIGTPWAKGDPHDTVYELYKDDPNYRVRKISVPATDEAGRSNFNFSPKYSIGFTDEFYAKMKETMDEVSYSCLYMMERIDREGMLFDHDQFEQFDLSQLNESPDAIHVFCDVAFGGGDFLSMPVVYQYGEDYYLADVVFNNNDKTKTQPLVCEVLRRNGCYEATFESNAGGDQYADDIGRLSKESGYSIKINKLRSTQLDKGKNAKLRLIIRFSPEIQKLKVRKVADRSKEYKEFLKNVTTFNQNGNNAHDDAPDSLARLFKMLEKPTRSVVARFRRRF